MTGRMIGLLVLTVVVGVGARLAWGSYVGLGLAALVLLVGGMILVLRRNQTDLELVERGKSPLTHDRNKRPGSEI